MLAGHKKVGLLYDCTQIALLRSPDDEVPERRPLEAELQLRRPLQHLQRLLHVPCLQNFLRTHQSIDPCQTDMLLISYGAPKSRATYYRHTHVIWTMQPDIHKITKFPERTHQGTLNAICRCKWLKLQPMPSLLKWLLHELTLSKKEDSWGWSPSKCCLLALVRANRWAISSASAASSGVLIRRASSIKWDCSVVYNHIKAQSTILKTCKAHGADLKYTQGSNRHRVCFWCTGHCLMTLVLSRKANCKGRKRIHANL